MKDKFSPLERRLKQYYKKQELPLDVMLDLKEMIGDVSIEQERRNQKPWYSLPHLAKPVMAFAIILICLGLGIFSWQLYSHQQQLQVVAAEIALNHAKRFNTEFTPTNIASLTNEMHLLDFAPVHPQKMQLDTYNIIGARYCTIDSSIAVQVHLENEAKYAYTLYEFREPEHLQIDDETVIDVGDIQVTLWKEGEVVMGLAHRNE